MSEPRRSTRARAREEATAPPPPEETPSKPAKALKRKRPPPTPKPKDSTPATPIADRPQQVQQAPKQILPTKIVDGLPLPTIAEPQPLDLPAAEYQDIQQSGVLRASLQRSRQVWTSGSNFRLFHANFIPPKKVLDRTDEDKQAMQRQKDIQRNFPPLGGLNVEAQLVIEPHTFPIRLYGPREFVRQAQKKQTPQYGQWPNHNQYSPYQHQPQQYNTPPAAYHKPSTPQSRPNQPKAQQKPPPPPPAPTTPAPDPVIHMLAQRAGTDPKLKSVMKIVAAGQASQEQLSYFQGHIAELTKMLEQQRAAAARAPPPPPPPPQPQLVPIPPPQTPQAPMGHQTPQQHHSMNNKYPPNGTPASQQYGTPTQPRQNPHPNQYTNSYNTPQQHMTPFNPAPQPPRTSYRPLIFDFVEGNGDKFYFPTYSIMEWLPNNAGVKFSFLITKMKPKPKPDPKLIAPPSTPAPKVEPVSGPLQTPTANPIPMTGATIPTSNANPNSTPNAAPNLPNNTVKPIPPPPTSTTSSTTTPATANPTTQPTTPHHTPPPRIEDFDEKSDIQDIEFYQPVTVTVLSQNLEILQSLPRTVRTKEQVDAYMEEVFDRCTRAEDKFLAFRLPRDGVVDLTGTGGERVGTPGLDELGMGTGMGMEGSNKRRAVGRVR